MPDGSWCRASSASPRKSIPICRNRIFVVLCARYPTRPPEKFPFFLLAKCLALQEHSIFPNILRSSGKHLEGIHAIYQEPSNASASTFPRIDRGPGNSMKIISPAQAKGRKFSSHSVRRNEGCGRENAQFPRYINGRNLAFIDTEKWSFYRGDRVELMVGKDKGKQGLIASVIEERNWVIVDGLNWQLIERQISQNDPPVYVREEQPLLVCRLRCILSFIFV